VALAVLAAGCGEDEPKIPRQDAADLRSDLLEAKRRLRPLRCDDLETKSFPKLERRAAELPEGSDVRETLEEGLDHLRSLVEADCADRREEKEETTETTEPDTTTAPPETTTTPPETTAPPTTDTQPTTPTPPTTPTVPQPDPDDGNGDGGGQGVPQGTVKPGKGKKDKG
jgi:hypothetical protein